MDMHLKAALLILALPAFCSAGSLPQPVLDRASAAAAPTEYKVLVPPSAWNAVMRAYGLGLPDMERDIFFFDTKSLKLYKSGLVLRARAGYKKGDSTVKLRPAPAQIPAAISSAEGYKCENDRNPAGSTYSCSLTNPEPLEEIYAAGSGSAKPKSLFDRTQEEFAGDVWAGLKPLGPVKSYTWEGDHPALGKLSFERWDLPGGASYFEISFRSYGSPEETEALITAFHKDMSARGIKPDADQSSKTYAAMQFFSRN
jgi:hypothetical protein